MICVTIACGSHTRMIAEHQTLADSGVQLVELRLDFLRREPDVGRLIPVRPTATIITVRRKLEGGLWRDTEENRFRLLRAAIAEGPEFVDLEVDIADEIPPYGKTRRIISFHDIEKMPENLDALHKEMSGKSPYFIKIAATPRSVDDMFRFIRFVQQKNQQAKTLGEKGVRVIGICMGETGKATRILAKKFGMPYTYSTFSEERVIAPGMLVYRDLLDLYHYEQTNQDTDVYGIIGNPLGHSLSPLIHNRSFVEQKVNAVYVPLPLEDSEVSGFVQRAEEFGIKGISVTIPHKVAVIKELTRMDPAVEKIGACNTVVFRGGEKLGYNTDYLAAVSSIEIALGGNTKDEVSVLDNKNALVLGAGGAAMAIAYGLKRRGTAVTICDINGNRAYETAKQLDIEVIDWKARDKFKCDVLANCTPVGMFPKVDETPLDKAALHPGMVVFDAVYNPENTLLIKNARSKGCYAVSGVEMFVGQACLQYKLFTGQKASATFMRQLVKDAISAAR
ncbi:MAG: shikimate dehydrogenase [Planctomycetaceae bacterium]|jgi:3-dehydroquinate dehydratase/shikimate dehydrogenase|nr:shikimate dehydrogenase [Planctomycetaceae bacterium]